MWGVNRAGQIGLSTVCTWVQSDCRTMCGRPRGSARMVNLPGAYCADNWTDWPAHRGRSSSVYCESVWEWAALWLLRWHATIVLSEWRRTLLPSRERRNCLRAWKTASSSTRLMWQGIMFSSQRPEAVRGPHVSNSWTKGILHNFCRYICLLCYIPCIHLLLLIGNDFLFTSRMYCISPVDQCCVTSSAQFHFLLLGCHIEYTKQRALL